MKYIKKGEFFTYICRICKFKDKINKCQLGGNLEP